MVNRADVVGPSTRTGAGREKTICAEMYADTGAQVLYWDFWSVNVSHSDTLHEVHDTPKTLRSQSLPAPLALQYLQSQVNVIKRLTSRLSSSFLISLYLSLSLFTKLANLLTSTLLPSSANPFMTDKALLDTHDTTHDTITTPRETLDQSTFFQDDEPQPSNVDLTLYQRPRVEISSLPQEILEGVFQWLDIRSLDAAGLVCKKWNECISNDSVWRGAVMRYYGTTTFGRVTNSLSWKVEMIERHNYLRQWKKSSGATHITFKTPFYNIAHFTMDFPSMRMVAFSATSDHGLIADPSKGKIATPWLKTNGMSQSLELTSAVAVSKFGLIYGFVDGQVAGVFFSKGTTVRTFVHFDDPHFGRVTASWLAQEAGPRTCDIGILTGGKDSKVKVWNATNGTKTAEFEVGTAEDPKNIIYLDSDTKDKVIVCTDQGLVYLWEMSLQKLTHIGSPVGSDVSQFSCQTDFTGGYVVVSNGGTLVRHKITPNSAEQETVLFSLPDYALESEHIYSFAMEKSPNVSSNSSTVPKLIPGGNARHVIATAMGAEVYIWNLRADTGTDGKIPLVHTVDTPFQDPIGIVAVAINSLVFAISNYQGMVVLYNLLTGKKLQLVTVRFPRRLLDFSQGILVAPPNAPYNYTPFHLELDPDASNPHGIVVVDSAVQYFEFGVDGSKSKVKSKGIKKRTPVKRSLHHGPPGAPRNEELLKEIDDDYLIMKDVNRDMANERRERTPYVAEGLTEEEQLSYALMLSQDTPETPQDKDVELAIKMSLDHEQLQRESEAGQISSSSRSFDSPSDPNEHDWELEQALKLSMDDAVTAASSSPEPQYQESSQDYDRDLELALKLSMME